jgi:hypothetical protein
MWNLRWQVSGFLAAAPNATKDEVDGRFLVGSGIRSANVRRAAIEQSWDQQLEQFARFSLILFVALYEDWLTQTLSGFPRSAELGKWFQFPSRGVADQKGNGVRQALAQATKQKSSLITKSFARALKANRRYRPQLLDAQIICYRYFKECRNDLLHGGGRAHKRLVDIAPKLAALGASDLGTRHVPEHMVFRTEDPVSVTLRGVIGFSEVVLSIVTTLDAELALTVHGEAELLSRWKGAYGRFTTLPADPATRERRVRRELVNIGFPSADKPDELYRWLRKHGIVM